MTPELSRTAADVKRRLGLQIDDPRYGELVRSLQGAQDLSDLPIWAQEAAARDD